MSEYQEPPPQDFRADIRYPTEEENPVNKLTQDDRGRQSGEVRREAAQNE